MLSKLLYFLFWLVGGVIYLLPHFLKDFFAQSGALLLYDVFRFRRRIILHNLTIGVPRLSQESMDDYRERLEALGRANMKHYVFCLLEIFERFHWNEVTYHQQIRVTGAENVYALGGKGFFFSTAHLGNWELLTYTGVQLKFRLTIITKALRSSVFDGVWVRSRKKFGLDLLEEKGSGLATIRAIRDGKAVGFIMDQHTGLPHGTPSAFLGQKAWSPRGLAILAWRLKVPVIPAFIVREEAGKHHVFIGAPLDFSALDRPEYLEPNGALNEAGIRAHVEICNRNIEEWIRRAPDQYLWIHRRFKETYDYRQRLIWEL